MGRSKKGSLRRSRTEGGRSEKRQGCRGLGWNVGQLGRALRPSHPPPPSEGKLLRPSQLGFALRALLRAVGAVGALGLFNSGLRAEDDRVSFHLAAPLFKHVVWPMG